MHMCLYCACIYMHNTCIYQRFHMSTYEPADSHMGTGPPRGPLEDWSGPEVGLTSKSRFQVALIQVAARPLLDVRLGSAGCSPESVPASYPNPT